MLRTRLVLLGALSACVILSPSVKVQAAEAASIIYEAGQGPFCGRCETLKIEVTDDGRVIIEQSHWAGAYRDLWRLRRRWRASAQQVAAFRDLLRPYRPAADLVVAGPGCADYITDQPDISVHWRRGGSDASLRFDLGCIGEAQREMRLALLVAPEALGISFSPLRPAPEAR